MAARKRRRASAQTARVALVLALNAAAALLLWRLWPRDDAALAAESPPTAGEVEARLADLPLAPPPVSHAARDQLDSDLRTIVSSWIEEARRFSKGRVHSDTIEVAIDVRELGLGPAGEVALDADLPLRPASNLKLVTTAAALVLLGPDFVFDTRFEAAGAIERGVLRGDLVVRAAADPLYERGSNGDVEALLAPALEQIAAAGVHVISGDVVLDEATFLAPGPGPGWPDEKQLGTEYCALCGAFSVNRGCVTATVVPGRLAEPARVTVFPRDHGFLENFGVRTEPGGKVAIDMHARTSGVLVRGAIGAASKPWSDACATPDPVELFGRVLCGALARKGVLVEGRLRRERGAPAGVVIAHLRTPLERYLTAINTDSTNAVADQVFLATAYATSGFGTREAGARATRSALERLGVPAQELVQVDGSGLSRSNRTTARQIAALIEAVLRRDERSARLYRDSLALAGETGTLDDRMQDTPAQARVRAKTGYIDGTSALSGVALALDNTTYVFSILVNYPDFDGLNSRCWKKMEDEVCVRLVRGAR